MKRHTFKKILTLAISLLFAAMTTLVIAAEGEPGHHDKQMDNKAMPAEGSAAGGETASGEGATGEGTGEEQQAAAPPAPIGNPGDVKISKDLEHVDVMHNGSIVRIQRIQDQGHLLTGGFTKTSRPCPPFCIQPIHAAPGVTTIGELELLAFLQNQVKSGTGVLVDARVPSWHAKGTIPGSVNIPFTTFEKDLNDSDLMAAMAKLGVTRKENVEVGMVEGMVNTVKEMLGMEVPKPSAWDFTNAKEVALWCNGMWCGQSPRAIKALVASQYPVEKIFYYRGGMQAWSILGLSVVVPDSTTLSAL